MAHTLIAILLLAVCLLEESEGQICPQIATDYLTFPVCQPTPCRCKGSVVVCRGSKTHKLEAIPSFNMTLTALDLTDNHLKDLTFQGRVSDDLERLSLHHCGITNVTATTFSYFKRLRYLDLGRNMIPAQMLGTALYNLHSLSLERLCLSAMKLQKLKPGFWRGFQNMTNLRQLLLFKNHLTFFSMTPLSNLSKLTTLELTGNPLTQGVSPAEMTSLETLSLSQCQLLSVPNFCLHGRALLPKLRILSLSGNFIRDVTHDHIGCLQGLESIRIDMNPLSKIYANTFSRNSKLRKVLVSHLLGPPSTMAKNAFTSSSIAHISFTHNYFRFNQKRPDRYTFQNSTNLTFLDLSGNDMSAEEDEYRHLNYVLQPLRNLTTLKMAYCFLWKVPEEILHFHLLTTLDLSHNAIPTIPRYLLTNLTSLRVLDLSYNSIVSIHHDAFPKHLRRNLAQVDLSGNRLNCDCSILWLLQWIRNSRTNSSRSQTGSWLTTLMKRNKTLFLHYPKDYRCAQGELLNATGLSETGCLLSQTAKGMVIALTTVLLVAAILLPLGYRFRWHVQYLIFMLRYERLRQSRDDLARYQYDAFVSYSSGDRPWVVSQLIPRLEKQRNLTLCIHERDFIAGNLIVDNIVNNIAASRKVVLLLSRDFSTSEWCQFELALTQKLAMERGCGLMVLVLLSHIPRRDVTEAMFAVLKTTTYIAWPTEEDAQHAFWDRLTEAIRD